MSKHNTSDSVFVTLDDNELDDVTGAGLFSGSNSFALIDLSNLLGLGNVGVLGDATSSNSTTTTNTNPGGLLGGFLIPGLI